LQVEVIKVKELYCGVDIHKEDYVGCIMDKKENIVLERSFPSTQEGAQSFMCGMPVKAVAIEACGMWRSAMKIFRGLGYEVKLTSPKKTKDIAGKKKTDKIDAKTLANLLRTGFLPEVYIPNDEMLKLRDIARHKENLTSMRSEVQHKIKSYMLREGIMYPKKLWTVKGLKSLSKLSDLNIQNWLRLYHNFAAEEKETMGRIRNISRNGKLTNLLMTIPGIAEFSALMILEEIADISRFETPKQLVMYAGLCPGVYQTGDTEYNVANKAVNKHLKWIITECSGRASIMKGTRFQKHYARINKRKGFKVARRSTARKMLTIIWHMVKNEEPYLS
jgi:transposase